MKNLLLILTLGLSLSVLGQNKPNNSPSTKIESTGNEITPVNSQTSTPIVTPSLKITDYVKVAKLPPPLLTYNT